MTTWLGERVGRQVARSKPIGFLLLGLNKRLAYVEVYHN